MLPCRVMLSVFISFYSWVIFHCMEIQHFIYSFVSWRLLDCFHFLATIDNAAVNSSSTFFWKHVFSFLLVIYQGVELRVMVIMFKFLEDLPDFSKSDYVRQFKFSSYMRVPVSPHPFWHLLLPFFFVIIIAIRSWCKILSHCGFDS